MAFDPRCSVFQITHPVDPQKYGTGFVIHLDTAAPEGPDAYLLTCAHVVDELGKALKVRGKDAQLMAMGDQAGLDLAVIKVSLPGEALLRPALTTDGALHDQIAVHGYRGDRLVLLLAQLYKYEVEKGKLRFYQFDLDPNEPDEVKKGYSGSPIVLLDKGEKIFAVTNTRQVSQGRHVVGACIPVWHLVKLWLEMPDELGAQLFGNAYWSLLQQVRPKTAAFTPSDYQQAFQLSCGPDELPEEYSLWGCAVSLKKFEKDSETTERLRGFFANLGIPGFTQKSVTPVAPRPAGELYRQLIIRIVKREGSRRDDADGRGGDRYLIETHLAQLEAAQASRCCASAGKECAPYIVRELSTIKARQTEEERRSGLKELLEEQIPDILASFGCHIPDLVQFIVPEDLLTDFIITNRIDQFMVRGGAEPLAELHPTVFSGAKLSNADEDGRYLLDCLNKVSPLQGPVIGLHDPELPSQMRRQLKKANEAGRHDWEGPRHSVTLSRSFWLGNYPVTQREYEKVMGKNPSKFKGENRPVEQVSWEEAVEFCRRLMEHGRTAGTLPEGHEFRLPTEAEWEYCCRAGSTGAYCFGDDEERLADYAWYDWNSNDETHEVGLKKANSWGLHDMHGNVWEWCLDRVESLKGYDKIEDGVVDPLSDSGQRRVFRGGGWIAPGRRCRSAYRSARAPANRSGYLGFRVCLAPSPAGRADHD